MPMVLGKNKALSNITVFTYPSPRVPIKAFAYICVHIFYTIYESGVLAHGGGGEGVVYGPKSNDRAGKNAVYV